MKEIIHRINESICAAISQERASTDVKPYGLAESVAVRSDEEVTFPAMVLPDGECISVYNETDEHDVIFYHRLGGISYAEDSNASFGSRHVYTETADMSLIVFGKREQFSQYKVEQIARRAIANRLNCTLVSSDFNALQIFASEYAGVTYFMGSAYYLFKINYRITNTSRCY